MTESEIQEQIDHILAVISNIRTAILAVSSGTNKSYSLNTGQTTQSVTKKDVNDLRIMLRGYLSDLEFYRNLLGGDGAEILRAL